MINMSQKKKKSCKKHNKFNYYCKDCRAANEEQKEKEKLLYPDAIEKGKIKEEKFKVSEKISPPYERGPFKKDIKEPSREPRYKYTPIRRIKEFKKYLLLLIPLILIIFFLSIFWFIPSWTAGINLQIQLYSNKAGGLNFVEIYALNFWSANFILNKTALIGAFIGTIIMSFPPERNLFTLLGTYFGWGRTSRFKAMIYWWTIGFGVFYLIGQLIDTTSYFSWAIYLLDNEIFDLSPNLMINAFNVLFDQNSTDLTSIFFYSALYLPLINFILGVIIFRIILNLLKNTYLRRNDFYALADLFLIIGIIFGFAFFNLPLLALDGLNLLQSASLILGFIVLIIFGIVIDGYGFLSGQKQGRGFVMLSSHQKKMGILAIGLIVIIIIPLIISIPVAINIESNTYTWTVERWNKKTAREVEWTRICAGLDMFEERTIENYTESTITPDSQIIPLIRQYDQSVAVQKMSAQIASKYESIADSDIIYIGGNEYWVSPKTLRMSGITPGGVELHTALFDHVEGFLAMDTFTGDLLTTESEYQNIFNVSSNYPIFFGERESTVFAAQYYGIQEEETFFDFTGGGLGAYETDILLNTTWSAGIENLEHAYEGTPDGELEGLEQFYFTSNLGLFPYALNLTESSYLINRNIKTRVSEALLPGLWIDPDPYLIFDTNAGKVYYGVSICTNIAIGSYSKSPIYRFLGICLIDLLDGRMTFYKNPALKENINDDLTYPFWKIYLEKYPWKNVPSWLKYQLRYPETLFEIQLDYEYIYHVQDPTTFRRGDDFHERPEGGDLFYIETDLGDGIEYVGIDLAEYIGREARILAGLYIIRHGENFGQAILYHTRDLTSVNLIGPVTAREYYSTAATKEIELITAPRHGNTLIYPLAGSLYYFVPTYAKVGGIQDLKLTGLIDGFSGVYPGYGVSAIEAYNALNITAEEEPSEGNVTLSYTYDSTVEYPNPANSRIEIEVDFNLSHPVRNLVLNVSIYSDLVNVSIPSHGSLINSTFTWGVGNIGYNYTLMDEWLYPGEGKIFTAQFYASSVSASGLLVMFEYTLIVDDVVIYTSEKNSILFTKNI